MDYLMVYLMSQLSPASKRFLAGNAVHVTSPQLPPPPALALTSPWLHAGTPPGLTS